MMRCGGRSRRLPLPRSTLAVLGVGLAIPFATPFAAARAQSAARNLVVLTIDAETGAPLPGVIVRLPNDRIAGTTDSSGQVAFHRLNEGLHRVDARRIGYQPISMNAVVGPMNAAVALRLHSSPRPLDTVTVVDESSRVEPSEFIDRFKRGLGQFITSAQLDSSPNSSLDVILATHLRGVRVVGNRSSGEFVTSLRQQTEHALGHAPSGVCPPLVYLDGVQLPSSDERGPDISIIQESTIGAVEFYNPSEIPARYRAAGSFAGTSNIGSSPSCGAMLIWSRR